MRAFNIGVITVRIGANAVAKEFLSCVSDDINSERSAFVCLLYLDRFCIPSFTPLNAPCMTKLANMNLAVIPSVLNMPLNPLPDCPIPFIDFLARPIIGIPEVNF